MKSIYKITNLINNKIYIGQSVNPEKRWQQHKSDSKSSSAQVEKFPIHHAINKYGSENFLFETIVSCLPNCEQFEVDEIESYFIEMYQSRSYEKGYNVKPGGFAKKGFIHSDESKKKMSESRKGTHIGQDNPYYGRTHSQETRNKMKKNHKGTTGKTWNRIAWNKGKTLQIIDGKRVWKNKEELIVMKMINKEEI